MITLQSAYIKQLEQEAQQVTIDLLHLKLVLIKAKIALKFYADLRYNHTMGFPPEVQWIAENAIKQIDAVLKDTDVRHTDNRES